MNGQTYVGKTKFDPQRRWKEHKWALNRSKESSMQIHKEMKKEGVENFTFEVIEECKESEVEIREIYWIKELNSCEEGYNAVVPREKNSLFNNLKNPKKK